MPFNIIYLNLSTPLCFPSAEFMTVMKRMAELEEKMTSINDQPPTMPPEKEEMLNATISRADLLEKELMATKKVYNLREHNLVLKKIDK